MTRPRSSSPPAAQQSPVTDGRAVRLPHGVRDYLPEAAARRRGIAEAVLAEVERWGYRRIITPAFEYEAVMARGLGQQAQAQAVRFVEPGTGEVVLLRPDLTPQVARLAATRLAAEPGPLRLSYEGAVVRLSHGGQRELFQAGVELLRAPAPSADVEVIALAASALAAAGVSGFVLDLGEAQVARAAFDGLDGAAGAELHAAVARKDLDEAGRVARGLSLPAWRRRLLEALPSLYGGPEVIDRAAALFDGAPRDAVAAARAGLRGLSTVIGRLAAFRLAARLSVDLGEVRGFDYYTGVRFSGYAPGAGDALLSGGRYDHLVERYGPAATAAGFAVDVERVALALPAEQPIAPAGIYLAGEPAARHREAESLRAAGHRVVEDLDDVAPAAGELRVRAERAGAAEVRSANGDAARRARESLDAIPGARYPASPARGDGSRGARAGKTSGRRGSTGTKQAKRGR